MISLSLYSVVLLVFGMPVYKMCKDETIKQIIKNRFKLYLTVWADVLRLPPLTPATITSIIAITTECKDMKTYDRQCICRQCLCKAAMQPMQPMQPMHPIQDRHARPMPMPPMPMQGRQCKAANTRPPCNQCISACFRGDGVGARLVLVLF